jgi:hypothetical protein
LCHFHKADLSCRAQKIRTTAWQRAYTETVMKTIQWSLAVLVIAAACGESAWAKAEVEAFLYNPTSAQITFTYAKDQRSEHIQPTPNLTLSGSGFRDGAYTLHYAIEDATAKPSEGTASVTVQGGWFMQGIELKESLPQALRVSWDLSAPNAAPQKGIAPLSWSRFHGKVKYRDGRWRPTYIDMIPVRFGAPGEVVIPVAEDGSFDVLVPARLYAIVNVNGAGYRYDALERWGWDYDLTRDREETFHLDRMELYSIHAFEIRGGPPTLFVIFRPTALSRVLSFDKDGDNILDDAERKAMQEALTHSPTAIGPELKAGDIRVWLDGKPYPVVQLNQIPEFDGQGAWQVQYLVQIMPEAKVSRFVWHEIKLEVESHEELRGKKITDFGEGSVGFRL